QVVEPAIAIEIQKIVAAANMMLPNEDLGNRRAPVRPLYHLFPMLSSEIHRNLSIRDALGVEQCLGSPAIGAESLGIDFDRHATLPSARYLSTDINASTAKVSPRAPSS